MQHQFIKKYDCIDELIVAIKREILTIVVYETVIINI